MSFFFSYFLWPFSVNWNMVTGELTFGQTSRAVLTNFPQLRLSCDFTIQSVQYIQESCACSDPSHVSFTLLKKKKKKETNKVALVCSTSKRCQHIQDVVAYVLCPFLAVWIYTYIRIKKMSKFKKKHVANSSVL